MGPALVAAAPVILQVAGAAVTAFAGFQAYRSAAAAAKAREKVARINQERAAYRGQVEAQDADFRAKQVLGEVESNLGASGLDSTTGSAADLKRKVRLLGRQDSLRINNDAQVEAWNFGIEASNARAEAKSNKTASYLSLVKGALDIGGAATGTDFSSLSSEPSLAGTGGSTKNIIKFKRV